MNTTSRIQTRIQEIEQKMENRSPPESLPVFNGNKKENDLKDELETLAQRIEYIESNTHEMAMQFQKVKELSQSSVKNGTASTHSHGGGKEDFTKMEEFVQTKTASLKHCIETLSGSLREDIDDIKIDRKLLKERVDVCNHNVKTMNSSLSDKLNDVMERISTLEQKFDALHKRQNSLEKHTTNVERSQPEPKLVEEKESEDTGATTSDDILKELENLSSQNQTAEETDPAARRRVNRRKKPVE